MLNWKRQQELYSSHVEVFEWVLLQRNIKISQLTKGHNWYLGIPTICWKILVPKSTKILSMRNPNTSLMSTSEYLCVESVLWITKYVREWLTTKFTIFKKKKKATVEDAEKPSLWFIIKYGRINCCKVIGFDAVDLRKNDDFKLSSSSFEFLRIHIWFTHFWHMQ
jgi:hypothetical protein